MALAIKSCSRRIQMAVKNDPDDDVPYAVNSYLTTIDTADIDTDYMNSRFEKYLKIFLSGGCRSKKPFIRPKRSCTRPLPPSRRKNRNMRIFSCTTFRAGQLSRSRERPCGSILPSTSPKKQNDQIHKVAEVFGLDERSCGHSCVQTSPKPTLTSLAVLMT